LGLLVLVTGGARSGKSSWAEKLAKEKEKVIYLATAEALDEEMELRIKKHQKRRPPTWKTIEEPLNLNSVLKNYESQDLILIDCFTLWLSNILFEICKHKIENYSEMTEKVVLEETLKIAEVAHQIAAEVIIVTNEVGCGIVPEDPWARIYRDLAGRANQILAQKADLVYFTVAGIPLLIKGPS
jgi:adenosylcobinamide kinase/adenosylcobinamide-phosphate guanylyltransferase